MRDLALRLAIVAVSLLLAAIGFIAAIVFFSLAAYLQFAGMMAPPLAAMLAAIAALLFSLFVMLTGRWLTSPGVRRRRSAASSGGDPAMEAGQRLGEEAYAFVNAHRRGTLTASLLAGFALGASPKLRTWLREVIGI